jgi:uncharacterized protein
MPDQSLATLRSIHRYPMKGLRGEELPSVTLQSGAPLPGDRALALRFRDASPDSADPATRPWTSKPLLAMQMDWPALAALPARFQGAALTLGTDRYDLSPGSPDRARFAAFATAYLQANPPIPAAKHPQATELELIGTPGGPTFYGDRNRYNVSIMSLATLRDLCARMGRDFTIHRFRGNLVVDGWEPWAELALVGRRFRVGAATLEITAPVGRCNNVNVHQETGQMDHPVLDQLKALLGHNQFGVMANVIEGGAAHVGDAFSPLPG